jgi:uncharacterized coiled-coil DUF342 family protein
MLKVINFIAIFVAVQGFNIGGFRRFAYQINAESVDPNFEAHLPGLLARGLSERSSPELANELRKRYSTIKETKKKAARELKSINPELAIELEEIADEVAETNEKFVQVATYWDAWSRPSPDLPKQLREKAEAGKKVDPNFEANLPKMLDAGTNEDRSSPDLPSELRLLKYKQSASVKRLAAKELRSSSSNVELAVELEEIADEIDETHKHYEELAKKFDAMRRDADSKTTR